MPDSFIQPAQRAATAQPVANENPSMPVTRATSVTAPAGKQMDFLRQLAGVALQYATPVPPGQLTAQQNAVLAAWKQNANSGYSKYMLEQGLSTVAQNPNALAQLSASDAAAAWSRSDVQASLGAMKLSADDWDAYEKLWEQEQKSKSSLLGSFLGIAGMVIAGVAAIPTGGLSLAAIPAIAGAAGLGMEAGNAVGDLAES